MNTYNLTDTQVSDISADVASRFADPDSHGTLARMFAAVDTVGDGGLACIAFLASKSMRAGSKKHTELEIAAILLSTIAKKRYAVTKVASNRMLECERFCNSVRADETNSLVAAWDELTSELTGAHSAFQAAGQTEFLARYSR